MNGDDDMRRALPDPPPPRPDRREAAIETALRRFDGEQTGPAGAKVPRRTPPFWRTLRDRPQFGALIAASLVAVICMPVLWVVLGNPRPEGPAPVLLDTYERMPGLKAPASETSAETTAETTARTELPTAPPAGRVDEAQSPAETKREADTSADVAADIAPPPPPPPPPPPAVAMAPPPAIMALPAPAPEERSAARAQDAAPSALRPREATSPAARGDWNACTLDDPARDLRLCADRIVPGADGARGRADTFMADGLLRGWQGDPRGAIRAFDKAVETAPDLADAYLNRALAHERAGDRDRALADLDRAAKRDPSSARIYYHRSLLLRARGDAEAAAADAARAVELDPSYAALLR